MIVEFDYYLHDELESFERRDEIARSSGHDVNDELLEKIGRPFYEVKLSCTLDTDTGAVVIKRAVTT